MRAIYNGRHLYHSVDGLQHLEPASQSVYDSHKYGLPELKKYPMPDAAHVKSAIKFFNYVSPKDEKTLANAILQRMKEYGVTNVNVGPDNRFKKYYNPKNDFVRHSDNSSNFLIHSSGPWEKHNYIDKVRDPNSPDGWRYIYEQGQEVGTRMIGQNENMHSANQGVVGTDQNQNKSSSGRDLSPTQQKKLQDFTEKPVSEVTGNKDSSDDKTKKGKGKGGSGGKGKSGSKSGKGSSGSTPKPGHAGKGKSGSKSSGSSGTSSKDTEAAKKEQKKLAKQQKKAQAEAKAEQRREKERQERKEAEQFEQRRRENEKRWKAEQERMENYRDTSNYKIDKNDYQKLVDMLKGSDKEYAKQLLEGGKSKIDEYLDWLKESRKNNK